MNIENYLFKIPPHKIKLGLERTEKLLEACNNPENQIISIQIIGTNGKGSTSAILSNILSQKYKGGLYTSPHLVKIQERIKINNKNIDTLILGCTHYPIIASSIENYFEKKINIIDSGLVTAQHIKRHLLENNLFAEKKNKNNDFYVSDNHKNFLKVANMFLKTKIKNLSQVSL